MTKILYICGSVNQTKMMHKISMHFTKAENYFSPFYADGLERILAERSYLDFSILGGAFRKATETYLNENRLFIDYRGEGRDYDLVFICTDLIYPKNIRNKKVILVQEGMTDPENIMYYLVKYLHLPRYYASTSTTGMSNFYSYFCVASEGYKKLFTKKGADPNKIIVTGIPNFDNVKENLHNEFPYKDFVLVATSDSRETFKYENRIKFIKECIKIAKGRQLIFKLHPNEIPERAEREIKTIVPNAIVYSKGNIDIMIANCSTLITKYSSVVFIGIALNKEVYSYFNLNELRELCPIQNSGNSAKNIAAVGKALLQEENIEQSYKKLNLILGEI